ncbi:MAG: F0F1 ATP synthase subunit A [Micavibrio aeruginosavorus]|uniref:ATP synthase subunit a n=1 Tax=Micavibrio aeruginosavorus TaxID=349221 RepID=A0A2W4ZW61_9BACT|nr:MAG: F0F1 ATP synthase subunit A [Micavibrio aeruginosavorus]
MANPIHQFEIQPLVPLSLGGVDLSFTNSALWMTIGTVLSIALLTLAMRRKALVPTRGQLVAEGLYKFISSLVRENVGEKGMMYFPFVFTLFMIVLLGNLLGMIPGSFTFTSHIAVTGVLALIIFFFVSFMGFVKHGLHFLQLFCPPGVPLWIAPLIVPIEIISYLSRPVTLSLRLFINMLAGHLMVKVIAGFSVMMVGAGVAGMLGSLGPMLFNVMLIGFEIFVAFVQAYVFALLTCIYLRDTVEMAH